MTNNTAPYVGKYTKGDVENTAAREYIEEVCDVANALMLRTGKVEGSHYAAMKVVASRWGIALSDVFRDEQGSNRA